MRYCIRDFVRIISETLPIDDPIYEFGSFQVPGQESRAELRPFFPGKEYIGCDMREGTGVDKILDLHNLDLPDLVVGTALIFETLEHVEYPRKAMNEVHRVLKPGGITVISSTMYNVIHDYPYDYWRFTPEAFKSLLKPFTQVWVGYAGRDDFPHALVGIGVKDGEVSLDEFLLRYEDWRRRWRKPEPRPWERTKTAIVKVAPWVLSVKRALSGSRR